VLFSLVKCEKVKTRSACRNTHKANYSYAFCLWLSPFPFSFVAGFGPFSKIWACRCLCFSL